MDIFVLLKRIPDLVEDLEVDAGGKALAQGDLKLTLNEFDDHALEEALLIKEASGATVSVLAVDGDEVDKMLYTALAKGADRALKITGAGEVDGTAALARLFLSVLRQQPHDLVLTGVQAADDRDGQLAPTLAALAGVPSIEVVTSVVVEDGKVVLHKEFSGGFVGEYEVDLPAVLGIQAARQSPRYAPVSRVRQVQESSTLETVSAAAEGGGPTVVEMKPPERGEGAEMLEDVAELVEILAAKGVL